MKTAIEVIRGLVREINARRSETELITRAHLDALDYLELAEAKKTPELRLVDRVARLNPDAGEIGAGMLVQLVAEARAVIDGNVNN